MRSMNKIAFLQIVHFLFLYNAIFSLSDKVKSCINIIIIKVIHIPIVMENGGKISSKHNEANKNMENNEAVTNHNNLNDSLEAVENTSSTTNKNIETKDVVTKYSKTESVCTQSDNCENKTMDSRQFTSTVNENLNGRCDNCTDASIRAV